MKQNQTLSHRTSCSQNLFTLSKIIEDPETFVCFVCLMSNHRRQLGSQILRHLICCVILAEEQEENLSSHKYVAWKRSSILIHF